MQATERINSGSVCDAIKYGTQDSDGHSALDTVSEHPRSASGLETTVVISPAVGPYRLQH